MLVNTIVLALVILALFGTLAWARRQMRDLGERIAALEAASKAHGRHISTMERRSLDVTAQPVPVPPPQVDPAEVQALLARRLGDATMVETRSTDR